MSGDSLDQADVPAHDPATVDRLASGAEPAPLSWPLVERRAVARVMADDAQRGRLDGFRSSAVATIEAAPLAPFRIAALIGAIIRGFHLYRWSNWSLTITTAVVVVLTAVLVVRPVPYSNNNRTRLRVVVELAAITGAVLVSGSWESPFALCLVPTVMLASFVGGTIFSAQLLAGSVLLVTLQHFRDAGTSAGMADAALWTGLLALVCVTSGLSYRAAQEAARQKQAALDRMGRLAEANA
ncbi:MAG TPA: hypothetical protein VGM78_13365, partial [Ilumatobacteraceae bacterium]